MTEEPKEPKAAGDKPASDVQGEPLKGEVSRTDSPGAGASAAPTVPPAHAEAPKPANPAAATTATTSQTSSATGQPAAPASADAPPAPAANAAAPAASPAAKPPAAAGAKPAAPATSAAKPAAPAAGAAPAAKPAVAAKPPASGAGAAPAAKAAAAHDTKPAPPAGPSDPPPPAGTEIPAFIAALQVAVTGGVEQISYYVGDWTVIVPAAKLLEVARFLRDAPEAAFDFCSDVTASDWPPRPQRFDVVYCLFSTRHRKRVRMKVRAAENDPVPSVSSVWPSSNWLEREVYDLFGVNFTGHPNRKRILMPDDWQGHPQRKDYPLEGPGELLMENPLDWLKLKQAKEEAEIE